MIPPPERQNRPELTLAANDSEERRPSVPSSASSSVPIVTYGLLAILVAVFAGMWIVGHGDVSTVDTLFGDKENGLIHAGQVWRLVTAIFLHANLMHLLVNSLSLYWLGAWMEIETFYGSRKFLLIFLISGVAGNLLSFARSPYPSLGASGAIFGLVGAGLIFPIRFRSLVPDKERTQILIQMLLLAAINLGIGFTDRNMHVDNMAHVGGLLGGGFAALFLIPDHLRQQARSRAANLTLWAAVALCVLVVGGSALAQWRWAVRNAVPSLEILIPAEPNPWWSIGIPKNWRLVNGQWFSPSGAAMKIVDSVQNLRDVVALGFILERGGLPTNTAMIGGKPALHAQQHIQGRTVDHYFLLVDAHRAVAITLISPPAPSAAAQRDFARILNSFRLLSPTG